MVPLIIGIEFASRMVFRTCQTSEMKSFAKNTSLGSDTNDEIVDTNDEILIPNKKDINDNIFKTSMQNQLKEVIKEKKQKFYEFKNSDNKNSEQ